jgi:hypothetical protein
VLREMMVVSLMHSHSPGSPLATSLSLSGLSLTETSIRITLIMPGKTRREGETDGPNLPFLLPEDAGRVVATFFYDPADGEPDHMKGLPVYYPVKALQYFLFVSNKV